MDHKAVEFLNKVKTVTRRLARWALRLQPFLQNHIPSRVPRTGMQMAFLIRHGISLKLQIYRIQEMPLGLHRKGEGCYALTQYIINLYKHICVNCLLSDHPSPDFWSCYVPVNHTHTYFSCVAGSPSPSTFFSLVL